jgi:hypothetical protein
VRRIVASLLVVTSPLLTAMAVGATEARPAGPMGLPASPAVVQTPAVQAPVTVAPPAAPAVVAPPAATAVPAPAVAHRAVKAIGAKAPSVAAVSDDVYTARLQAELCRARQIFCGLDNGGRYPGR